MLSSYVRRNGHRFPEPWKDSGANAEVVTSSQFTTLRLGSCFEYSGAMSGHQKAQTEQKKERLSNAPVRLEPKTPGKNRWHIWNTEFEMDEKYVPIKVSRCALRARFTFAKNYIR